MSRVFVTRHLPGPAVDRLRAEHDVEVWPDRLPPPAEVLREHTEDADGLLSLLTDRIDANFIDACPRLTAVANYAVGYDNIDVAAATRRGIRIGNTPDVLTDATADLAFALLLAAARRIPEAVASVYEGDWITWEPGRRLGTSVQGATLGIIGFGRIGRAVAKRASGFDMPVLHADTRADDDGEAVGALLAESDFISIHCPLTPQTRHLIDADALGRMRSTAILINTARGPIIDQVALRQALVDGEIAAAALDVTDPEPLPPDDPLLTAPNLIVVPHIGSATKAARERMADLAVDNLLAALAGRDMPHQVNPIA